MFTGLTKKNILNTEFMGCINLKELTIPFGIEELSYDCFSGLSNLEKINIPNSVTRINNANVFRGCNLKRFEAYGAITYIGGSAFRDNKNLISCIIPNAVVTMLESNIFQGCYSLESFTIPETVTEIRGASFNGCRSLKTLTIPRNVTKVSWSVFNGCTSMEYFIFLPTTPPTLDNKDSFDYTNNCPIYVPAASVNAYKTATNWSNLASRIQAIVD